MTIKDMAAAFHVVNENQKGDGDDKIATIECYNIPPLVAGREGPMGGDDPKVYDKPEFKIKRYFSPYLNYPCNSTANTIFLRELIHLPNIADTVD